MVWVKSNELGIYQLMRRCRHAQLHFDLSQVSPPLPGDLQHRAYVQLRKLSGRSQDHVVPLFA